MRFPWDITNVSRSSFNFRTTLLPRSRSQAFAGDLVHHGWSTQGRLFARGTLEGTAVDLGVAITRSLSFSSRQEAGSKRKKRTDSL